MGIKINNINENKTYFSIIANNTVGVLNRITSLLMRRNYNIGELNLTFDNKGFAKFLIHIDTSQIDSNQIADQILKLFDVKSVNIIDDLRSIKKVFYVYSKNKIDFDNFDVKPDKITSIPDQFVAIYIFDFEKGEDFYKELQKSGLKFYEKSI